VLLIIFSVIYLVDMLFLNKINKMKHGESSKIKKFDSNVLEYINLRKEKHELILRLLEIDKRLKHLDNII